MISSPHQLPVDDASGAREVARLFVADDEDRQSATRPVPSWKAWLISLWMVIVAAAFLTRMIGWWE